MKKFLIEVDSDFGQLWIENGLYEGDETLDWDRESYTKRVSTVENLIGLGVIDSDSHKIPVSVHSSRPEITDSKWDHVVEVSIACSKNEIYLTSPGAGLENPIPLDNGEYRIRYSIKANEDFGGEYCIDIWPETISKIEVVKQMH